MVRLWFRILSSISPPKNDKHLHGARLLGVVLCTGSLLLAACGSTTASENEQAQTATVSTTAVSAIDWLPCGSVQCGRLSVLVDSENPSLGSVKVSLYRRPSPIATDAKVLLLVGDRVQGITPRELAAQSPLRFGITINGYNVVSVAVRGMADSPLPLGQENRVASLDVADDLEDIRIALGVKKVLVMGWGSGATAVTAWQMMRPESIEAAVVDSPSDPSVSMAAQLTEQLASSERAGATAIKWCASHLSCSMNAGVADEIARFRLKMAQGRLPELVTKDVWARAASQSIAQGRPGPIFDAMLNAIDEDNGAPLNDLAGAAPTVTDAYAPCADVSREVSARIAADGIALHATRTRAIHIGTLPVVYSMCEQLPDALRPLGAVKPADKASGARMMVTIARGDPLVPSAPARTMAKRMQWTYKSVPMNRHLVIGFDQAITAAAMEFLGA